MKLVPTLLAMMGVLLAMSGVTQYLYEYDHPEFGPGTHAIRSHPVVVKGDHDYTHENIYGVGMDVQERFCSDYTTASFSRELQSALISDMAHQANEKGLDGNVLRRCIEATGITKDKVTAILPCYAEYAYYNGTRCWEITMNWEYLEFGPVELGHIMNFLVDGSTYEVVAYETCD
jgi:hypothetical protein